MFHGKPLERQWRLYQWFVELRPEGSSHSSLSLSTNFPFFYSCFHQATLSPSGFHLHEKVLTLDFSWLLGAPWTQHCACLLGVSISFFALILIDLCSQHPPTCILAKDGEVTELWINLGSCPHSCYPAQVLQRSDKDPVWERAVGTCSMHII